MYRFMVIWCLGMDVDVKMLPEFTRFGFVRAKRPSTTQMVTARDADYLIPGDFPIKSEFENFRQLSERYYNVSITKDKGQRAA